MELGTRCFPVLEQLRVSTDFGLGKWGEGSSSAFLLRMLVMRDGRWRIQVFFKKFHLN
jgi:hypothetical protein